MCKSIMIQGTASHVGKSIVVTALCRIFSDMGVKVAPFKAQNMALNSFITKDGKEIGRAQAVQAEAARIDPCVEMNPILLKPTTDLGSQVIFMGRPVGNAKAREYYAMKERALDVIREAYESLCERFDLIVLEGAGSPAEINLAEQDIVNMRMAELADAPVILVSDIDRGGVFASLIGTMALLKDQQRERVRGFLINKFRGDRSLLAPGLKQIEERTGKPVFGVLPYIRDLRIEQEDSVALSEKRSRSMEPDGKVRVGVVRLPRLSNYTDLDPLEGDPGMDVIYVDDKETIRGLDVVIIPGSKDTIGDLRYLKETGMAHAICDYSNNGGQVIGLCGGFQMLGKTIEDPHGVESAKSAEAGLGLLPVETVLAWGKVTAQVQAVSMDGLPNLTGYEIHMGKSIRLNGCSGMFRITKRNGRSVDEEDGAQSSKGNVWGTYIHGIFENAPIRRRLLDSIRKDHHACSSELTDYHELKSREFARLAGLFREYVDMDAILQAAGLG
ncbi:MAG: cobyric acid synthase CobQ [Nitrospirae bacterium CG_4_9_14_3_um_filter_53_35]|nr:MAG: cobyric acid synthase CobQ [Nitrospirae bacterium CG08_land_8_20_14_0_20_52_24]PIW84705.1 MAG: cobyric acid synthase CobQ [Nitrospirae bacterium CG_4_8_14_3_um_filter_50_41]PIX86503.1 MAG: cobyric acid synthase CobQ [Nitrospirae bacterium CG_4_10_14_3_um_filter_53_41]PJA75259.1 MAG: cobyric acid synthase CobQ [Nitrospirae bacterium CG_4_9_14_3_um_filter_53_35]